MKKVFGTIASPQGFYADGIHCGLKRKRKDLGIIYSDRPAQAAAVYTTNALSAAPIAVTKAALETPELQAIIVNSGNANAFTGQQGKLDAQTMQKITAETFGLAQNQVAVASTGVIGQKLSMDKIQQGIPQLTIQAGTPAAFHEAILTTDTSTKEIVVECQIAGKTIKIAGVAKGSGMIHPNMATMLAFITTDAPISAATLQQLLKEETDRTFNQITIDGDTSTNDMVIVMANGAVQLPEIQKNTHEYQQFQQAFHEVMETLAILIAKDGEGATKLIEVTVQGCQSKEIARMIAKKIVGSALVKTAIFGADPNWGRIVCAIGNVYQTVNPDTIDIQLGGMFILKNSQVSIVNETKLQEILAQNEITIVVDLHEGAASGTAWGCDLTYRYVEINALYRT